MIADPKTEFQITNFDAIKRAISESFDDMVDFDVDACYDEEGEEEKQNDA